MFTATNGIINKIIHDKNAPCPLWDRWSEFGHALLNSQRVVPLWEDKNFRWGYQVTLNIMNKVEDMQFETWEETDEFNDFLINMAMDDDTRPGLEALLKGLHVLNEHEAPNMTVVKAYKQLQKDINCMISLTWLMDDVCKADEQQRDALIDAINAIEGH